MASPTVDAGTHATFNITSFSSASTFSSTANLFETSGANELAVAVITYQGMALAGGSVTSFTITASAVVLTFALYSRVQSGSGSHYQTIEIWTCQVASQFNSGAATTTTALVLSQVIDDGMVSVFAVEGLNSLTTPFDPNAAIPTSGTSPGPAPPTLTFSTSNADDLLFFVSAQGDYPGGMVTPSGWTSIGGGGNFGGARYQVSNLCIKSVSATQSGVTVQDGSVQSVPSWTAIVTAFTADATTPPYIPPSPPPPGKGKGPHGSGPPGLFKKGKPKNYNVASEGPAAAEYRREVASLLARKKFVGASANGNLVAAAATEAVAVFTPSIFVVLTSAAATAAIETFAPSISVVLSDVAASGVVESFVFSGSVTVSLPAIAAVAAAEPFSFSISPSFNLPSTVIIATAGSFSFMLSDNVSLTGVATIAGFGAFAPITQPDCDLLVVGAINPAQVVFGPLTDDPVVSMGCLVNSPVIVQAVMCCSC